MGYIDIFGMNVRPPIVFLMIALNIEADGITCILSSLNIVHILRYMGKMILPHLSQGFEGCKALGRDSFLTTYFISKTHVHDNQWKC